MILFEKGEHVHITLNTFFKILIAISVFYDIFEKMTEIPHPKKCRNTNFRLI